MGATQTDKHTLLPRLRLLLLLLGVLRIVLLIIKIEKIHIETLNETALPHSLCFILFSWATQARNNRKMNLPINLRASVIFIMREKVEYGWWNYDCVSALCRSASSSLASSPLLACSCTSTFSVHSASHSPVIICNALSCTNGELFDQSLTRGSRKKQNKTKLNWNLNGNVCEDKQDIEENREAGHSDRWSLYHWILGI